MARQETFIPFGIELDSFYRERRSIRKNLINNFYCAKSFSNFSFQKKCNPPKSPETSQFAFHDGGIEFFISLYQCNVAYTMSPYSWVNNRSWFLRHFRSDLTCSLLFLLKARVRPKRQPSTGKGLKNQLQVYLWSLCSSS